LRDQRNTPGRTKSATHSLLAPAPCSARWPTAAVTPPGSLGS